MRRSLRCVAIVLGAAFVAACQPTESSVQQGVDLWQGTNDLGSGTASSYDFGGLALGTSGSAAFVFKPASQVDAYTLTAYSGSGDCTPFGIFASKAPLPLGPPAMPITSGTGSAGVFYSLDVVCTMPGSAGATECTYPFTASFTASDTLSHQCLVEFTYTSAGGSGLKPDVNGASGSNPLADAGSGGGSGTYVLTLNGSGMGEALAVTPSSLTYDTPISTAQMQQADLTAVGSSSIPFSTVLSDPDGVFSYMPASGTASNTPTPITVTCESATAGTYTGKITFSSSATQPVELNLSCTVYSSSIVVSPNPIDLVAPVNTQASDPVTITNNGTVSVTVTLSVDGSASSAGVAVTPTTPFLLIPGGSGSATVTWTPKTQQDKTLLGNLVVMGDTTFNTPIYGTANAVNVVTDPVDVNFGLVCTGSGSDATVQVYNVGNVAVTLDSVSVNPANGSGFDLTVNPQSPNYTLTPGGSGGQLTFSVQATTAGTYTGSAVLALSMGSGSIGLLATAVQEGVNASPSAVAFGPVLATTQPLPQGFQLTNCTGSSALTITSSTITGVNAESFELVLPTNPVGTMIAPGSSASFVVGMGSGSVGPKTATLTLGWTSGATTGSTEIPLSGSDIAGAAKNRETFYACSTSGGAGGWPVLAALGVCAFAWRRRRG